MFFKVRWKSTLWGKTCGLGKVCVEAKQSAKPGCRGSGGWLAEGLAGVEKKEEVEEEEEKEEEDLEEEEGVRSDRKRQISGLAKVKEFDGLPV